MGKALVIKNVSFIENKLATVSFTEAIPCTAITLDESSISLTGIGSTATLTAIVTPSNTTDSIVWSSNNPDIVNVSGGVVTQVGIGNATITATCGTQSTTCSVTATNTLTFSYDIGRYNHKSDVSGEDYVYNESASGSQAYASLYSTTEVPKRIRRNTPIYPILIGEGATTITATVPNTIRLTAWFTNSNQACDYSIEHPTYDYLAKLVSGDASAFDSTVPLGNRTLTVPAGADSIAMSLQYPGGALTDEIIAGITIVAS